MENTNKAIELLNICKTFDSGGNTLKALNNVSLSVKKGEVYGIIGISGAGKSTLVRCINLLETPDSGKVLINGVNICELKKEELRRQRGQIGMIFQQFNLLMQCTVLENVCFPMKIAGESKKNAQKRAEELLEIVGLSAKRDAYPAQLSGGQKQRVAIARALACNMQILLCDEATSALDNATTEEILQLLRRINKDLGVTIVIITHSMSVIEKICTHVSVIENGEIAETSTVTELFTSPKSTAAKRLVLSKETEAFDLHTAGENQYRIVFNGSVSNEPIIANMILRLGVTVNIIHANLQVIDGLNFGQMVIELPKDSALCQKALEFLASQGIAAERLCEK